MEGRRCSKAYEGEDGGRVDKPDGTVTRERNIPGLCGTGFEELWDDATEFIDALSSMGVHLDPAMPL